MQIEVSVWRKKPIHYATPPDFNNLDFLVDPDLESATIERGDQDIHVRYNWQGNRSSEAYVINDLGYRKVNLAYPNLVVLSQSPLNFWLNRQNLGGGRLADFPGITWYSPSSFAGTASLNGGTVLVFAADSIKPGTTTYPEANSICLDPVPVSSRQQRSFPDNAQNLISRSSSDNTNNAVSDKKADGFSFKYRSQ